MESEWREREGGTCEGAGEEVMWVGAVYDCVMMEFTWVARSLALCNCDCATLYSLFSAQGMYDCGSVVVVHNSCSLRLQAPEHTTPPFSQVNTRQEFVSVAFDLYGIHDSVPTTSCCNQFALYSIRGPRIISFASLHCACASRVAVTPPRWIHIVSIEQSDNT